MPLHDDGEERRTRARKNSLAPNVQAQTAKPQAPKLNAPKPKAPKPQTAQPLSLKPQAAKAPALAPLASKPAQKPELSPAPAATSSAKRPKAARDLLLEDFREGTVSYDAVQADSLRLFEAYPARQAEVTIGLWGHETEAHGQRPLTDPRYLEDALAAAETMVPPEGSENYPAFRSIQKAATDIRDLAPDALRAQQDIARLDQEILDAQRARLSAGHPIERQRLDAFIMEKEKERKGPEGILSGYAEKARDLELLRAAGSLGRMIEGVGSEEAYDELFNVMENALEDGGEGFLVGLLFLQPFKAGATGALSGAVKTIAARMVVAKEDLRELPQLLKEDPEQSIELMEKVGLGDAMMAYGDIAAGVGMAVFKTAKKGVGEGLKEVGQTVIGEGVDYIQE